MNAPEATSKIFESSGTFNHSAKAIHKMLKISKIKIIVHGAIVSQKR